MPAETLPLPHIPPPHCSPRSRAISAVQELVALVASTKDTKQAQEIERTRRLAWEAEQEAKYARRQAEMERQMLDMRNEIAQLRSLLGATPNGSPAIANLRNPRPASPISPVSQPSAHSQHFLQGSSTFNDALRLVTPTPSLLDSEAPVRRKRRRSVLSSEDDTDSDNASSECSRPRRTDHHDKRILTITRAIRAHILLSMGLPSSSSSTPLPDAHTEGAPLEPPAPVRFVWDKTTKQSAHNGRMKLRILDDFRDTRKRLYKHVPEKECAKKVVDSAFEQAFTTLRQKWRTQRDVGAAERQRDREDAKARKSRHVARRKTKLSNRADARLKLPAFEHVAFDGAMQLECMSSEESDFDGVDPAAYPRGAAPLQTRGYAWRSARLLRFYALLDAEDAANASAQPKRGVGRRERVLGPHKDLDAEGDNFCMPPRGVASWMLSRGWVEAAEAKYPDFGNALSGVVVDVDTDWGRFDAELGPETDEEEEDIGLEDAQSLEHAQSQQLQPPPVHHNPYATSTSSLQCALAP
ncbi:hypothetical protein K438DRAFT_782156 [Mycena galopus ATCC 62051]|nr:hypothetical protein K438DRAFT_782156 [Mycena galopus ATCC 62051]